MGKMIRVSDEVYEHVVRAAERCGFKVGLGRGSELGKFLDYASTYYLIELEAKKDKEKKRIASKKK